jgi:hypothetical protein
METAIKGVSEVNKIAVVLLKDARLFYSKLFKSSEKNYCLKLDYHGQKASDYIKEKLASNKPCMICRIGSNELKATINYLDIVSKNSFAQKSIKYIRSDIGSFWWDDEIKFLIRNGAGFFPANATYLERFANLILRDLQNVDILGSWLSDEIRLAKFFPSAKIVCLTDLEPYYHINPWSEALEGKRVLVIHPFEESIRKQYKKHSVLFNDPRVLPKFELKTLKAIQSIAANKTEFSNWFDALAWMCKRINGIDFDIAIIGAGAYGLPLASFVKNIGKKGIHIGGATQILFGIKGNRWDKLPFFRQLYNDNWVRPLPKETPDNFQIVESGCYW